MHSFSTQSFHPLKSLLVSYSNRTAGKFSGWQQNIDIEQNEKSWRFDCLEQAEYWTNTHFWIFEYGRETDTQREHQIVRFSCHNMSEEQIAVICECMESLQCPLHIREEMDEEEMN